LGSREGAAEMKVKVFGESALLSGIAEGEFGIH
jgi:hypothetical protein